MTGPRANDPANGGLDRHLAGGATLVRRPADYIGGSIPWLRHELAARGFAIPEASPLSRAFRRCASLRRVIAQHGTYSCLTRKREFHWLADAFAADFLSKTIHRAVGRGLEIDVPFWRALGDAAADVLVTRRGPRSQSRDLVWELVIASLCTVFAEDVCLAEPDVTCKFEGHRIAIAAKSFYGRNLWARVDEGLGQARPHGELSLVLANAAGVLPAMTWLRLSRLRAFTDPERALAWASSQALAWCDRVGVTLATRHLSLRADQPIGVVFFMPLILSLVDTPVSFLYPHMPVTSAGKEGVDFAFTSAFCVACGRALDPVDARESTDPALH